MGSSLAARCAYRYRLWACLLVLVYLPLDLTFRMESFLLNMSVLDLAVDTAAMALIMAVVAAPLALADTLVSEVPAFLLARTRRPAPSAFPSSLCCSHYLILFLCCHCAATLFKFWAAGLHHEIPVRGTYLALLFSLMIYLRNRAGFHQGFEKLVAKGARYALPAVLAAAVTLTGFRMVGEGVRRHRTERPATKQVRGGGNGRPNVIIISFDALAAEEMSLYGYRLKTTPHLEAFAGECFVFDNFIAAANWTRPSVASLLTGKYPCKHRLINSCSSGNLNLAAQESLPAVLKGNGYRTSALVANLEYAHPFANGTAASFDDKPFVGFSDRPSRFFERIVLENLKLGYLFKDRFNIGSFLWLNDKFNELMPFCHFLAPDREPHQPPEEIFGESRRLLSARKGGEPTLQWLHIIPPHAPYLPPKPFAGSFLPGGALQDTFSQSKLYGAYLPGSQGEIDRLRLRYDENLLWADAAFGRYLEFLRDAGRLDDSIVIVTADHGESFSHGYQGHAGRCFFGPAVRIPLLVHLPGQTRGTRVASTASQVDLSPTLLDLLGLPVPGYMDGRSLKPALQGGGLTPKAVFSMNLDGNAWTGRITKGSAAVMADGFKYVLDLDSGRGELYNLREDGGEGKDVAGGLPRRARAMEAQIRERLARDGNRQQQLP